MKLASNRSGRARMVRIALTEAVAIRVTEVLELANTNGVKLEGGEEPEITAALAALRGTETATVSAPPQRIDPRKGRKLGPRKPKVAADPDATPIAVAAVGE